LKNLYILVILITLYGCNNNQTKDDINISKKSINKIDKSEHFTLKNSKGRELNISIQGDNLLSVNSDNIKEKIVLINIFSSWCKPCMGQIPYLAEIQKRESEDLLIIGLSINDDKSSKELNTIFENSGIRYFISTDKDNYLFVDNLVLKLKLTKNFSIPLSIIYKEGKLFRYYQGAMPMEMLQIEIKNAKKLL
jgi:thiol-disulfide isomerase/thioredoxin